MKKYIAYGSNLNYNQMMQRCPGSRVIGTGEIQGYRLVYRGGSRDYGVGNLIKDEDAVVPVAVYRITAADERSLDRYEGYPHLYFKKNLTVHMDDGNDLVGMAYLMPAHYLPARPSFGYIDIIRQGYYDFGLDKDLLDASLAFNRMECYN